MHYKKKGAFLCLLAFAAFAGGCGGKTDLKEQAISALNKQQEITSYTFTGEADIDFGDSSGDQNSNPITTSLQQMLLQGNLSWKGTASTQPLRMEATLEAAASGASPSISFPIIIADNNMYVNIPLINKPEEYFQIDFAELSQITEGAEEISSERLSGMAHLTTYLNKELYQAIDEKWFAEEETSGTESTRIAIDITDQNSGELTEAIRTQWPSIIDNLKGQGLFTEEKAEQWKQKGQSITVQAPGQLTVLINEQGYASEQAIQLSYTWEGATPKKLNLRQAYGQINENPEFEKAIPEQVQPFINVLRLFLPSAKQQ